MRENTILFIDDDMISQQEGLTTVPVSATKHPCNPVIAPTYPWEQGRVYIFGSVIREPETGLFRMWYQAADRHTVRSRDHYTICYAESDDGIKWHKPLLNISGHQSRRISNIVHSNAVFPGNPYCASVIRDDEAPQSDEQYKMTVWYEQWTDGQATFNGAAAFHSPDGLHWEVYGDAAPYINIGIRVEDGRLERLEGANDVNCVSPDKLDGRFVSWQVVRRYVREGKQTFDRDLIGGDRLERVLAMHTSDDFVHWTEPEIILAPTPDDPDYTQFYGMGGFRYGQYWLGTLWVYYVHDQSMDIELAYSMDGRNWTRPFPGHRLVGLGNDGSFDCGMLQSATAPLMVGDRIYLYYGGNEHRHDESGSASIGLTLNAYANGGEILAELLDEEGQSLSGFEFAQAVPIVGDRIDHRLTWSAGSSLAALKGRRLAVRLDIQNGTVYALNQV